MEIWLILNGKRSGPYPDYEIRGRIEHGEMEADEKVWHEGLEEWTPVGELELFRNSFGEKKPAGLPPALPPAYLEKLAKEANHLKPKAHFGRRFWARWMDLTGYSALWWLGMYFSGRDIGAAIANPWLLLTMYLPWFAIEAWLIQRYGTTPGKWLMGLRVVNEDGSALALKPAMLRSLRVMVTGIGFGWGLLSILCQAMSWFTTRRLGKPIWDHIGGHKVVVGSLGVPRILAMIFVFHLIVATHFGVYGRYSDRILMENFPEQREFIEMRKWMYFPERK